MAAAVTWFPVVGALIGAAVGGLAAGLGELVPATVAAAVAVLFGVLLTGAFHEDGLADTADAIAGGWSRQRRFEILRDPRHGSYGVAALSGSIVVRIVAVGSLGPAAAFAGLVSAHTLGRGAAVAAMGWAPVARPDGLGADYAATVYPPPGCRGRRRGPRTRRRCDRMVGRAAGARRRRPGLRRRRARLPIARRHHRRHPRRHRAGRRVHRARRRHGPRRSSTSCGGRDAPPQVVGDGSGRGRPARRRRRRRVPLADER